MNMKLVLTLQARESARGTTDGGSFSEGLEGVTCTWRGMKPKRGASPHVSIPGLCSKRHQDKGPKGGV